MQKQLKINKKVKQGRERDALLSVLAVCDGGSEPALIQI